TLAARDVADDRFAPDWITTAGPVHQEIAVTFHANGVGVSAENPANDAGEAVAIGLGSLTVSGGTGWGETTENLASGGLAITDAGHKVVRTAETIVGSDLLIVLLFEVLERNAVFARLLFDQLASDFNGSFTLVDIEPVLNFLTGARGLDDRKPVPAGLVAWLSKNFDNVATV